MCISLTIQVFDHLAGENFLGKSFNHISVSSASAFIGEWN